MSDEQDIKIMLARAANITERTLDRFAGDHWGPAETDYARKLIADLAAAAGSATPGDQTCPRCGHPRPDHSAFLTCSYCGLHDDDRWRYEAAAGSATPDED
jgi:hypothetical protein